MSHLHIPSAFSRCDVCGEVGVYTPEQIALDYERSKRFGEPIPTAEERARLRHEGIEHIDVNGQLQVPLASSFDSAPKREGWQPFFVTVNLNRSPQKWVTYRRPKSKEASA